MSDIEAGLYGLNSDQSESRGARANPNPIVFLDDATLNTLAMGGNYDAARELRLRAGYAGPRGNAMAAQQASQGGFPPDGPRTFVPDQILRTSEPYGPWRSNAQIEHVLRMNPVTPDERARVGFPRFETPQQALPQTLLMQMLQRQ